MKAFCILLFLFVIGVIDNVSSKKKCLNIIDCMHDVDPSTVTGRFFHANKERIKDIVNFSEAIAAEDIPTVCSVRTSSTNSLCTLLFLFVMGDNVSSEEKCLDITEFVKDVDPGTVTGSFSHVSKDKKDIVIDFNAASLEDIKRIRELLKYCPDISNVRWDQVVRKASSASGDIFVVYKNGNGFSMLQNCEIIPSVAFKEHAGNIVLGIPLTAEYLDPLSVQVTRNVKTHCLHVLPYTYNFITAQLLPDYSSGKKLTVYF